ncbi:MAG: hypothetical protein GY862_22425, partial [Gammaproteobacteria bacterium]|nr:hypothetical protein [Gammaproteobacteria bacterium]
MICTFYSFKGGVGRSMALANIAELLYRRGLKVLMVDFDLEAPGLESYFGEGPEAVINLTEILEKRGIIDMLLSYRKLRTLPRINPSQAGRPEESQNGFPFPHEPLSDFITPIYGETANGGSLSLISAGRRAGRDFPGYANRIRGFDWNDFYTNWDGELYFEQFRRELEASADIVLIDSRTGVTEMSGVCTYQLADVVIMLVAPNQQNLNGTEMIAQSLANPKLISEGRQGRSVSILPVPSRVERAEGNFQNNFAKQFQNILDKFLAKGLYFEKNVFLDLMIPHVPFYAYLERVSIREPEHPSASDLNKAYERLAVTIAQLAPTTAKLKAIFVDSILIVTVTKEEAQAVLESFSQASGRGSRRIIGDKTYYDLGIHGGAPIFMVQCEMGIDLLPGGALLTADQAIRHLKPQAVILCGIAFGLRPDKQQLGDILIAQQVLCYERPKMQGEIALGDRVTASIRLLDRFRSGDMDWQGVPTHFGLVLSSEKLVNAPDLRDWFVKTEPKAIGGEMEGAGLYAAAHKNRVDWIVVKAICDWADGSKNDEAQALAAHNAAQFVLHVVQ